MLTFVKFFKNTVKNEGSHKPHNASKGFEP